MKKFNIYKVLTIALLASIVLSYLIPGTTFTYGVATEGTIQPVTFADLFTNGLTSMSAFLTTFTYILVVGVFYAVLKKTGKYETLVNNTAASFNKNKRLFLVLTIFGLGLFTLFTNEMYVMLIFVPFLISVIKKLGYSKETSLISTVGAILIGQTGSVFTYYINQMLSLTVNDNLLQKIIVSLVGLVFLFAFILLFDKKPESTKDLEKIEEKKMLPLKIILISLFVLLILGFVNWNGLFKFEGFNKFLESMSEFKISKVSVFDAILGKTVVAFGTWQLYNASVLFLFIGLLLMIIYRIKINDMFEAIGEGLKKAFPYALIVTIANIILVNVFSSGIFYTVALAITKKTVSMFTGLITAFMSALVFPDYNYAIQFSLEAIKTTSAKGYENLLAVLFQTAYCLFLLISPTSIILMMGLKYNDIRYRDWLKYVYKFFLMLLLTALVIISLSFKGFDAFGIVALVLLVIAVIIVIDLKARPRRKSEDTKEEIKKEQPKKVETKSTKKDNKKKNKK